MRELILAVTAGLALAGCGGAAGDGNVADTANDLAAEEIIVNDPTAIDAVSGEDANLAADSEIPDANAFGNDGGNNATGRNSD